MFSKSAYANYIKKGFSATNGRNLLLNKIISTTLINTKTRPPLKEKLRENYAMWQRCRWRDDTDILWMQMLFDESINPPDTIATSRHGTRKVLTSFWFQIK